MLGERKEYFDTSIRNVVMNYKHRFICELVSLMIKFKEDILSILNCRIQLLVWMTAGIAFVMLCSLFGYSQASAISSEFVANSILDYIKSTRSYIFLGVVLGRNTAIFIQKYTGKNQLSTLSEYIKLRY